jgi:hypothetical protein
MSHGRAKEIATERATEGARAPSTEYRLRQLPWYTDANR